MEPRTSEPAEWTPSIPMDEKRQAMLASYRTGYFAIRPTRPAPPDPVRTRGQRVKDVLIDSFIWVVVVVFGLLYLLSLLGNPLSFFNRAGW